MPNPENIVQHKMKPGTTLNPNGRPKKLVSHVNAELKALGFEPVSITNVSDCFMLLINLPLDEIKKIAAPDTEYPFLYKLVAKELLGKRGAEMLERVLDRGIGKAKQHIDNTHDFKNRPDWLDAAK